MKKIISVIIILVVVLIIIALVGSNKAPAVPEQVENTVVVASSTSVIVPNVNLVDGSYSVSPSDAKLTWTGKKKILKNWIDSGTIALKSAEFEVKDGAIVSNSFLIDMTSIKNLTNGQKKNQDLLTKHLKSADFFDVENFATSTFIAKEFTATTSDTFLVKGDLTIKSVTNEITIPVSLKYTDSNIIVVKGKADIDRTLWGIKYGSDNFFDNLGDNIIENIFSLNFELQFKLNAKVEGISTSTVESI